MNTMMSLDNVLLPLAALLLAVLMLRSRYSNSPLWRATITPLASIIGSGFLIVAPLLAKVGGSAAPWLMLLIVAVAYLIGSVMRFNIRYAETLLISAQPPRIGIIIERISNVALSFAYIISITFYLRLLASFSLDIFAVDSVVLAQLFTTVVLLLIGVVGWRWGLHALEKMEIYSVTIKLAIISALLLALFHYDLIHGFTDGELEADHLTLIDRVRMLAGMLLVVQGFETSRYLGHEYDRSMRIRSMRLAQWIATVIYIAFVFMVTPLLHFLSYENITETAIITLTGYVVFVLPFMLVTAAVMSQFSAAVGDTLGAGGLIEEETRHFIPQNLAYLCIALLGIVLVWFANVFEIVAMASRAFALYYLFQTIVALCCSYQVPSYWKRLGWRVMLVLVSALLATIVIFAIPVV